MSDLPKPGEVWGVPDKPETWRLIEIVNKHDLFSYEFGELGEYESVKKFAKRLVRIFPKDTP